MSSTNNNGIDNVPPAVGLVSPPPFVAAPPVAAAPGFFSPPPRPSMAVLQAQLAHATAQLGQANARVAVLETDVTLLTNNVEELEVNVEELEDSVGDLQDDIHDLERNRPRRRNPDRGANKKQKVEAIGAFHENCADAAFQSFLADHIGAPYRVLYSPTKRCVRKFFQEQFYSPLSQFQFVNDDVDLVKFEHMVETVHKIVVEKARKRFRALYLAEL